MSWVLVVGAGWLGVGAVVALIVGRSIRLADAKARAQSAAAAMAAKPQPNFAAEPPMVDLGPATVPSFDAQVAGLPVPREVPPVKPTHPPVISGCVPASERGVTREPGLT
jgi:hypothetical protein